MFTKPENKAAETAEETKDTKDMSTKEENQTAATGANRAMPAYGFQKFGGVATSPNTSVPQSESRTNGRKLVVGQGINMSGEIDSCDYLIVEGKVEAALKGASVMDIAESGIFYGTVEIEEATIAGNFEGDLTVKGRLTIRATGSITGAISYGELAVEAGATLDGKLNPLKGSNRSGQSKPSSSSASKKVEEKTTAKKSNDGSELPFGDRSAVAAE